MRPRSVRELLDDVDVKLLEYLKINARTSVRELSRAVGRSPSVVHGRLKRLERIGVVRGYTALLDYRMLGYEVYALTLLQVDGEHITEVEKLLAREPNVRAVFDITGEYDVAILTVFSSVSELDAFIKRMLKVPYIKRSVTNLVLRVVKDEPHIGRSIA
ncbi:MAG: Lrp/AsnC family transcriptional regulator [Sulfolobales archaeon]|nr:Lrp/AsnC family transcriptional regulator [Sulfolobales archaeon]